MHLCVREKTPMERGADRTPKPMSAVMQQRLRDYVARYVDAGYTFAPIPRRLNQSEREYMFQVAQEMLKEKESDNNKV